MKRENIGLLVAIVAAALTGFLTSYNLTRRIISRKGH